MFLPCSEASSRSVATEVRSGRLRECSYARAVHYLPHQFESFGVGDEVREAKIGRKSDDALDFTFVQEANIVDAMSGIQDARRGTSHRAAWAFAVVSPS